MFLKMFFVVISTVFSGYCAPVLVSTFDSTLTNHKARVIFLNPNEITWGDSMWCWSSGKTLDVYDRKTGNRTTVFDASFLPQINSNNTLMTQGWFQDKEFSVLYTDPTTHITTVYDKNGSVVFSFPGYDAYSSLFFIGSDNKKYVTGCTSTESKTYCLGTASSSQIFAKPSQISSSASISYIPISNNLRLSIDKKTDNSSSFSLYDLSGRSIMNIPAEALQQGTTNIDLSQTAPGVYLPVFRNSQGATSFKVIR